LAVAVIRAVTAKIPVLDYQKMEDKDSDIDQHPLPGMKRNSDAGNDKRY
jgi:hypothetical protein